MRLQNARKISLEQVPVEQQQSIGAIAGVVNDFMEEVVQVINGNINFDNLQRRLITLPIQTNAEGNVSNIDIRVGISPKGVNVGNVYMTDNPSQVPNITSAPFVCFSPLGNGLIRITKILNLQKNSKYTLTLEFY